MNDRICLVVEGRLCGTAVPELQRVLWDTGNAGNSKAVELDLSGVLRMDAAGRSLVRRLRGAGVAVRNLDPLSESLMAMQSTEVAAA